jgi:NADH:ubiquinone oxidoreductase subunit C
MNYDIENRLKQLQGGGLVQNRLDGLWMDLGEVTILILAELMKDLEARLTTISAISIESNETELIYHFAVGGQAVNVKTRTQANAIPSITTVFKAANWIERENHDFFGVNFIGHPNLVRLLRPPQLAEGFFPSTGWSSGGNFKRRKNAI